MVGVSSGFFFFSSAGWRENPKGVLSLPVRFLVTRRGAWPWAGWLGSPGYPLALSRMCSVSESGWGVLGAGRGDGGACGWVCGRTLSLAVHGSSGAQRYCLWGKNTCHPPSWLAQPVHMCACLPAPFPLLFAGATRFCGAWVGGLWVWTCGRVGECVGGGKGGRGGNCVCGPLVFLSRRERKDHGA